VTLNITSEKRI